MFVAYVAYIKYILIFNIVFNENKILCYYDFCFVNTFFIDDEILSKWISVPYVVFLWLLLHFQPPFLALTSIRAFWKAFNTKNIRWYVTHIMWASTYLVSWCLLVLDNGLE